MAILANAINPKFWIIAETLKLDYRHRFYPLLSLSDYHDAFVMMKDKNVFENSELITAPHLTVPVCAYILGQSASTTYFIVSVKKGYQNTGVIVELCKF